MPPAETYEKCLETVHGQFRIMESFSTGSCAAWYQEVVHFLNQAKDDLEN